ncbi:neurturin isoform X1 [Hyla sarda]|uniref:neurturin isoform X1 n=1 Tax=Hyla sarda TaxID=327740 RepID=UPI0024C21324|nr:neurturin isoform X1 [Hyla sarda]
MSTEHGVHQLLKKGSPRNASSPVPTSHRPPLELLPTTNIGNSWNPPLQGPLFRTSARCCTYKHHLHPLTNLPVCRDSIRKTKQSSVPHRRRFRTHRADTSIVPAAQPSQPATRSPAHQGLPSPPKRSDTALFESYTQGEIRELVSTLVERYSQSIHSGEDPKNVARMKRARARKQPCTIKELEVRVSELGLGYISDETVLFRYCSGTCETAVRNYDLSLQSIQGKKKIKKEKVRAKPCCRPLAYDDDISFLDAKNHYHTIKEVSAKDCGCI